MKTLLCTLLLGASFSLTAQNEIVLNFQHLMGDSPFSSNSEIAVNANYSIEYGRMEYYLSDFTITHDGGQETFLEDVYLLVNADEVSAYSLGTWNIDQVESLAFAVGVDEAHNHLDPAEYEAGHPLAPQFPSMHWGWASGYRFVAAEGVTGSNMNIGWEIHALGDQNFFDQSHDLSGEASNGQIELWLNADYNEMFVQLDISEGVIEHSAADEALKLLENMRDYVFSSAAPVSVTESEYSFTFYPNPASEQVILRNLNRGSQIALMDMTGKQVLQTVAQDNTTLLDVSELPASVYFLRVGNTTQKLVLRR